MPSTGVWLCSRSLNERIYFSDFNSPGLEQDTARWRDSCPQHQLVCLARTGAHGRQYSQNGRAPALPVKTKGSPRRAIVLWYQDVLIKGRGEKSEQRQSWGSSVIGSPRISICPLMRIRTPTLHSPSSSWHLARQRQSTIHVLLHASRLCLDLIRLLSVARGSPLPSPQLCSLSRTLTELWFFVHLRWPSRALGSRAGKLWEEMGT